VVIHVTAGDAATVARIQSAAEGMEAGAMAKAGCKHGTGQGAARPVDAGKAGAAAKAGVYSCSMGDYSGPRTKDGRCPKCGMSLSLQK